MSYKIEITKTAAKFLKSLPAKEKEKVTQKIQSLAENPRCEGVIKLTDVKPDTYRTRQGNYRILYHIKDDKLIIEIIDIDDRKNSYR